MDADHDGIADNNRALKIGGETSYDLSKCKIYGYTDGDNAYTGDISIVLRSGTGRFPVWCRFKRVRSCKCNC